MKTTQCSKCQGAMEEGFVLDTMYGGLRAASRIAGAPEKSFWRGVKVGDKQQVVIAAFRCTACGFLEFYAKPEQV